MTHDTLGPVDAIWLNTDHPENLMVIDCLVLLDGPLDHARIEQVVRERLVERYPVFSRRPAPPSRLGRLPRWEPVANFDATDHLRTVAWDCEVDDSTLQDYVSRFVSTPLSWDQPLWEMHLIEGTGDRSAIYVRMHHALADGIALTRLLLSITDGAADGVDPGRASGPSRRDTVVASTLGRVRDTLRRMRSRLVDTPLFPRLALVVAVLRHGGAVLQKVLLSRNPRSVLSGKAGTDKRVVWSEPVALDRVKAVGRSTGTTVNDVLLAGLTGALRSYQQHSGARPVDLATMVPVNLRPLDKPLPKSLGNQFAVVLLTLPAAVEDPYQRLLETKRRMDAIKASPEALITFGLINAIGLSGRRLSRLLVRFFSGAASGVTTNVPGPREHRYLAGSRITGLLGWVPGQGNQTLGTCIFSYAGSVRVGFKTDAGVVPAPERILRAFHDELETLFALVEPATAPIPQQAAVAG